MIYTIKDSENSYNGFKGYLRSFQARDLDALKKQWLKRILKGIVPMPEYPAILSKPGLKGDLRNHPSYIKYLEKSQLRHKQLLERMVKERELRSANCDSEAFYKYLIAEHGFKEVKVTSFYY